MKRDRLGKRVRIGHENLEGSDPEVPENACALLHGNGPADLLCADSPAPKSLDQVIHRLHEDAPHDDALPLANKILNQVKARPRLGRAGVGERQASVSLAQRKRFQRGRRGRLVHVRIRDRLKICLGHLSQRHGWIALQLQDSYDQRKGVLSEGRPHNTEEVGLRRRGGNPYDVVRVWLRHPKHALARPAEEGLYGAVDRVYDTLVGALENALPESKVPVVIMRVEDVQKVVDVKVGVGYGRAGESDRMLSIARDLEGGGGPLSPDALDLVDLVEDERRPVSHDMIERVPQVRRLIVQI